MNTLPFRWMNMSLKRKVGPTQNSRPFLPAFFATRASRMNSATDEILLAMTERTHTDFIALWFFVAAHVGRWRGTLPDTNLSLHEQTSRV